MKLSIFFPIFFCSVCIFCLQPVCIFYHSELCILSCQLLFIVHLNLPIQRKSISSTLPPNLILLYRNFKTYTVESAFIREIGVQFILLCCCYGPVYIAGILVSYHKHASSIFLLAFLSFI